MIQFKTYRFRIYPNRQQATTISQILGCKRYVHNRFVAIFRQQYPKIRQPLTMSDCQRELPKLIQSIPWLENIDPNIFLEDLRYLTYSLKDFKEGNHFPKYKKRTATKQSYPINRHTYLIDRHYLYLPEIGRVRYRDRRYIRYPIIKTTITKTNTGKYYVSLLSKEDIRELPKSNSQIGIDLGLESLMTLSDGIKIKHPHYIKKQMEKLKREQRRLSRRLNQAKKDGKELKDAKNYQKQRMKVAKIHEKIANQRIYLINQLTTELIKNHDVICIEDLDTKGLIEKHQYAQSISDASWHKIIERLLYKAKWYGKKVIKVSPYFPSSQLCSECGYQEKGLDIGTREWECPRCRHKHDRDINASKNILKEGMRIAKA